MSTPSPTCQVSWTEDGVVHTDGKPAIGMAHLFYRDNAAHPSLEVAVCQEHFDQLSSRQYDVGLGAKSPEPVHVSVTYTRLAIAIAISPGSYTLAPNESLQFTATVTGATNTAVIWTAAQGSITASGLYTAPNSTTATVDTVTATSAANRCVKVSAQVSISALISVVVLVSPQGTTVNAGGTAQFTATVNGITDQRVTWSVYGVNVGDPAVGTVSATGLYTAPASLGAQTIDNVLATSVAYPSARNIGTVTVNANVAISVTPSTLQMGIGEVQQFTATVAGTSNQQVTWSAMFGSINAQGLYTAPSTANLDKITATSVAFPTVSWNVYVTVAAATDIVVLVNPPGVTVNPGQTQQFTASITNLTDQRVIWSVYGPNIGDPAVGTISSTGLYTAPASLGVQSLDTVLATSVAYPSARNVGSVAVNAGGVVQLDLVQWSVGNQRTSQHLVGDPHAPYSVQMLDTDAGYPANYPRNMIWQIKNKLGNPWDARRYDSQYIYHWLTEDGDSVDTATCQAVNGTTCWLYARAYKRFVTPLRGWPRFLTPNAAPVVIDSVGPNTTNRTTDCEATLSGVITLGDVRTVTSGPTKYSWGGSIDHGAGTGANGPTLDSVNGVDTVVNLYYYSGTIAANDFRDREEYYFVLGFGEVAWYYYHRANASSPWVWQNQTVNSTLAATGAPVPNFPCGPGKSWFV